MGSSVTSVATPEKTIEARTTGVDFALIGHQESWRAAADVLAVLRGPERTPLPDDEIKDILPWIPPRAVCHVEIGSVFGTNIGSTRSVGAKARGLYIDSFIPPDRLGAAYIHENIARVRGAAACAIKAGAKIVSLGGFSSILIEGNFDQLPERNGTVFTTGNTLTVAFIVQGITKMCALEGRNLRRSTLLIVGATGDVGSGCARCLAPLVKRVLLSARNAERLRRLATELQADGVQVEIATDLFENGPLANNHQRFSAEADVVICAASLASPSLLLGRIAPDAIVCDAGYPKNLSPSAQLPGAKIFFGGLGQITGGLKFAPDFHGILNRHPFPDVVHGCLLEGMALALERRFEPFSQGRGFITPQRVEEMEAIAARHGIYLAPLYNSDGPVEDEPVAAGLVEGRLHGQKEWTKASVPGEPPLHCLP
jgi:fatty aldehyde-generating acyl-ACP reductase